MLHVSTAGPVLSGDVTSARVGRAGVPLIERFWPYLLPHRNRIGYIGWIGHDNLGDEVMYDVARARFRRPRLVPYKSTPKTRRLERVRWARGLYKAVLLGGGTLVNAPNVLASFVGGIRRYGRGMMLGPGVLDPDYWGRVPGWRDQRVEWAEVLEEVRVKTVRGPRSKALLEEVGVSGVEVIGDPALGLADETVRPKSGRRRIGVNLGTVEGRQWGREEAVLEWSVRLVGELRERGWKVSALPMCPGDATFLEAVSKRLTSPLDIFREFSDAAAVLEFLRSRDVFVGFKLHSVILAHCAYTPALMLEYRPKCLDHMLSVGQEELLMRTDALDLERALYEVDRLADHGAEVQNRLATRIRAFRTLQERVYRLLESEIVSAKYPRVPSSEGPDRGAGPATVGPPRPPSASVPA